MQCTVDLRLSFRNFLILTVNIMVDFFLFQNYFPILDFIWSASRAESS